MTREISIAAGFIAVAALVAFASCALGQPAVDSDQTASQPVVIDGEALFSARCKSCHEPAIERAPDRATLATFTRSAIVAQMTDGAMAPMSKGLSEREIDAIAAYLAPAPTVAVARQSAASPRPGDQDCQTRPAVRPGPSDWPRLGVDLPLRRFQPTPGLNAADVPRLKVKWSFALGGGVYGQPTVVGDYLFITSRGGQFYALDARTGCVYWRADGMGSRTTPMIVRSSVSPSGWATFVGASGRVARALDAQTGNVIWTSEVLDSLAVARLTGAPSLSGEQLFVPISSAEEAAAKKEDYACCSFRGSLAALDATTGKVQWKTYVITEPLGLLRLNGVGIPMQGPAGAAIWSAPAIDENRGLVYVATGNSYTEAETKGAVAVVAIDMKTGAIRWSTQVTEAGNYINGCAGPGPTVANCPAPLGSDYDFGSSPILFTFADGRQIVLSGQKSGMIFGVDPESGRIVWRTRVGSGSSLGGVEWGMAADSARLYVPNADTRNLIDEILRPLGKTLRTIQPGPAKPGLSAIDPATGEIIWSTPTPLAPCRLRSDCIRAQSAPPAVMPGVVFSGSTDGWLRAYDSATGAIIWAFSTTAETYAMTNGVENQPGGAIDGSGPTIANGMVFTMSGYNGAERFGGNGVNVLLAFSVDGK